MNVGEVCRAAPALGRVALFGGLLLGVGGIAASCSPAASDRADGGRVAGQAAAAEEPDTDGSQAAAVTGRVRMARLSVDLTGPDSIISVRVRYELSMLPSVREIPLRALAFAGATFRNVIARVDDREIRILLRRSSGSPLVSGVVPLEVNELTSSLDLEYEVVERVFRGDDFDISVPVLLVDWPLEGTRPGLFIATTRMPVDYALVEVFPTVPLRHSEQAAVREYELEMQVVPSLVRFRGRLGTPPVVTFARTVDLAAIAVILLGCFLGWWGLRGARQ